MMHVLCSGKPDLSKVKCTNLQTVPLPWGSHGQREARSVDKDLSLHQIRKGAG